MAATNTRMNKELLKQFLRELPGRISGTKKDTGYVGRAFKAAFVHSIFTSIRKAYLVKSTGGTDDLGIRWKPLSKSTIAQRPLSRGDKGKYKIGGERVRGLLTPEEDRLWRGIFASTYSRLRLSMGDGEAKAKAGQTAWAVLKARGAKTKLHTLGNRKLPILIVSERLLESVSPGKLTEDNYAPKNKDQKAEIGPNRLVIGSKVPYFVKQNKTRIIIPLIQLMGVWKSRAKKAGLKHLIQRVRSIAK